MSIMNIRNVIAATVAALVSTLQLHAQELEIDLLKKTQLKPWITNIFIYGAGSRVNHGNLWTASNTHYGNNDTFGKYSDIGAGVEAYRDNGWFQFSGTIGYKYQNYNYDKKLFSHSGIDSHWLSTDIKTEIAYFGAGLKSDIFLRSIIRNNNNFDYNGIYPDCFNNMTLCWYGAMHVRFTRLKAEVRIGSYIVPHLNAAKISYYNLIPTHIDRLYFEIRMSFRIFTTGSPFSSSSSIL